MKTKNLIYIGIGGVLAYILLKRSNKKAQEEQVGEDESGVIKGVFVGGVNVPRSINKRVNKQEVIDKDLKINVRKGRVVYGSAERPSLIGKELPKFRKQKTPNLFGIEVPKPLVDIFRGKPMDVYYGNLDRITPLEVFTPVRYKDRILGNIFVSTIDENNNMIWRNEATGQEVNIIYPTR